MAWQWHQLDHIHIICTSLQTDNHANTSSLSFYPSIRSMGGIIRLLYVFLSLHTVVWEGYFVYCMFIFFCFCFVCSVKLFSAVAGPIGAKFGTRHEPDARQVLRDFWGATPRDREIIAQNVRVPPFAAFLTHFISP